MNPYAFPASRLDFEAQLMACLDIYQAITEERPYREGLPHKTACEIFEEMAAKGYINNQITADIKEHFA